MKCKLFFSLFILCSNTFSQIERGMNYLKIGGVNFNQEVQGLETYPVYTDTTGGDSIVFQGSNKANVALSYHFAIAKNFTIGFTSRFLCSPESSYRINAAGLSFRYHFPLGKERTTGQQIVFEESNQAARNFFFVDLSGLYGNLKYNNQKESYTNGSFQFGLSMRVPTSRAKFIRHLGIEISGGVCYRSIEGGNFQTFPLATGGILFYLDRHYTHVN